MLLFPICRWGGGVHSKTTCFILATVSLLGTIFKCKCKTDDATRCKHKHRYCYIGLTCEYYYIIDGQT